MTINALSSTECRVPTSKESTWLTQNEVANSECSESVSDSETELSNGRIKSANFKVERHILKGTNKTMCTIKGKLRSTIALERAEQTKRVPKSEESRWALDN